MKRRSGVVPDDRHLMTLSFIERIGGENFLEEAKNVHSLTEIGRFYGNRMETVEDLAQLLKQVESSPTH